MLQVSEKDTTRPQPHTPPAPPPARFDTLSIEKLESVGRENVSTSALKSFLRSQPSVATFRRAIGYFSLLLGLPLPLAVGAENASFTGYLAGIMDQYHKAFDVYSDFGAAGNNFNVRAMIGNAPAMVEDCTDSPHSGNTCIKVNYDAGVSPFWGGWYFMNGVLRSGDAAPLANWGEYPNAGINLTGATKVTFWARGATGGERAVFFCLGIGRDSATGVSTSSYPDSSPQVSTGYLTLTSHWTQYTLDLTGHNLNYVLGGFGWVATTTENNNHSIVFYLDDIQYDKSHTSDPRLLVSYQTVNSAYDFDRTMRNVAFVYDNALAAIAFLAAGDSLRAKLINDAFVYAQAHDRYYNDGRLRNGYQGGELTLPPGWTPNGKVAAVRIPNWQSNSGSTQEDPSIVGSSTGNVAWAILSLLSYYQTAGGSQYLDAAQKLGEWIETNLRNSASNGGYGAGYYGSEPAPMRQNESSTEHNCAIYAAFARLYRITGDAKWNERAVHARAFVQEMWDGIEGKFWSGKSAAGAINKNDFPLDCQTLPLLALNDQAGAYAAALAFAEKNHRLSSTGGFDFNTDKDGIWYEGTAQIIAAYWLTRQDAKANATMNATQAGRSPAGALYAANIDGLSTGYYSAPNLPWVYYRREHVGTTAWGTLAQSEVNPFWWSVAPVRGELMSLSTRGLAEGGETALIGGLVIAGPAEARKTVLFRGVGPTLGSFGLHTALSKPLLTLWDSAGKAIAVRKSQNLVATGGIDPIIQQSSRRVGAFDLSYWGQAIGDTALLIDLAPGLYTVSLTPDSDVPGDVPNRDSGVVLLELYDISQSDGARFVSLSTRAPVGSGEQQLIVGFFIAGNALDSSRLLLRGIGPTLRDFGVANALTDTNLILYDAQGTTLATNDDWGRSADVDQIVDAAQKTGAFQLSRTSKDAAILMSLQPGGYSAIVQPLATGKIGLAEIYEVP